MWQRAVLLVALGAAVISTGLADSPSAQAAPYYRVGGPVLQCEAPLTPTFSLCREKGPIGLAVTGTTVWTTDDTDFHVLHRFDLNALPSRRGDVPLSPDKQITFADDTVVGHIAAAADGTLLVGVAVGVPDGGGSVTLVGYKVIRLSPTGERLATYDTAGWRVTTGQNGGFYIQLNGPDNGIQRYAADGMPVGPVFAEGIDGHVAFDGQTVYLCDERTGVFLFTALGSPTGTLSAPRPRGSRGCFAGPDGTFYVVGSSSGDSFQGPYVLYGFTPETHALRTQAALDELISTRPAEYLDRSGLSAITANGDLLFNNMQSTSQASASTTDVRREIVVYRRDNQPPQIDRVAVSPYTNRYADVSLQVSDPEDNLLDDWENPGGRETVSEYSVNGGPYQRLGGSYWGGSFVFPTSEPEGVKWVAVRIRDAAGHLSFPLAQRVLLTRQKPTVRLKLRWVHDRPRIRVTAIARKVPLSEVGLAIVRFRPGVTRRCEYWVRSGKWFHAHGDFCAKLPGTISLPNRGNAKKRSWTYSHVRWANGFSYQINATAIDAAGNSASAGRRRHFLLPHRTKKPLKCKRGFRKKKVRGKAKCVKIHKEAPSQSRR